MNGEQTPAFFDSNDDGYVIEQILKYYLDGSLHRVLTASREQILTRVGAA